MQSALDSMPDEFMEDMQNVAVVVADEPTDEEYQRLDDNDPSVVHRGGEILGLYDGIPLTERYFADDGGGYPDVITIFKGPHERLFHTKEELAEQVRKTVVHEIGHHFGLGDARLHEIGY